MSDSNQFRPIDSSKIRDSLTIQPLSGKPNTENSNKNNSQKKSEKEEEIGNDKAVKFNLSSAQDKIEPINQKQNVRKYYTIENQNKHSNLKNKITNGYEECKEYKGYNRSSKNKNNLLSSNSDKSNPNIISTYHKNIRKPVSMNTFNTINCSSSIKNNKLKKYYKILKRRDGYKNKINNLPIKSRDYNKFNANTGSRNVSINNNVVFNSYCTEMKKRPTSFSNEKNYKSKNDIKQIRESNKLTSFNSNLRQYSLKHVDLERKKMSTKSGNSKVRQDYKIKTQLINQNNNNLIEVIAIKKEKEPFSISKENNCFYESSSFKPKVRPVISKSNNKNIIKEIRDNSNFMVGKISTENTNKNEAKYYKITNKIIQNNIKKSLAKNIGNSLKHMEADNKNEKNNNNNNKIIYKYIRTNNKKNNYLTNKNKTLNNDSRIICNNNKIFNMKKTHNKNITKVFKNKNYNNKIYNFNSNRDRRAINRTYNFEPLNYNFHYIPCNLYDSYLDVINPMSDRIYTGNQLLSFNTFSNGTYWI